MLPHSPLARSRILLFCGRGKERPLKTSPRSLLIRFKSTENHESRRGFFLLFPLFCLSDKLCFGLLISPLFAEMGRRKPQAFSGLLFPLRGFFFQMSLLHHYDVCGGSPPPLVFLSFLPRPTHPSLWGSVWGDARVRAGQVNLHAYVADWKESRIFCFPLLAQRTRKMVHRKEGKEGRLAGESEGRAGESNRFCLPSFVFLPCGRKERGEP